MIRPKKGNPQKRLKSGLPRNMVGPELVNTVRVIVGSNRELPCAPERLLGSYRVLLVGTPITDAQEILWQVDGTLLNAERSSVLMSSVLGTGGPGE
jgi:hypothetical protein